MRASVDGHQDVVHALLEKGADIEAKDNVRTLMIIKMVMVNDRYAYREHYNFMLIIINWTLDTAV